MTEKVPTDILEEEHRFIQKVVGALPTLIESLEMGRAVEAETLRGIVEFMRTFADKCHHGKEEAVLFPVLAAKGVPTTGCPIGGLTHEHQQGRALVTELAAAVEAFTQGDASAKESLIKSLRGVMDLYPQHIWKEDYLLFPMTNKVLGLDDQKELLDKFAKVEDAIGRDTHRRFEQLADKLLASLVFRLPETDLR
jgi:hemerythrin-like domain-containing protein